MKCVWEHNGKDSLLYSTEYIGACTRGNSLEAAMAKLQTEIEAYALWAGEAPPLPPKVEIIQEKASDLNIYDADSDVLFDSERLPLTLEEYESLKCLALKSAADFHALYVSIDDKNASCLPLRKTFYGQVPRTAQEMYDHTKSVNAYYFGEIGVEANNEGTIYDCRKRGFELLERTAGYLRNPVVDGSYGELWSLRKVLRRFIWHDRIHAKAMYRMATKTFGDLGAKNIFHFNL